MPQIKPSKKDPPEDKEYEAKNNYKNKSRNREAKKDKIKIDREETLDFTEEEKQNLPNDVEFKGYREVIIQNVKITTENVKVKIPIFYSALKRKNYEPKLPEKYSLGEFGAGVYAFTLMLYFLGRVTMPKIKKIFNEIGIIISPNKILSIINEDKKDFSIEKKEIIQEGIKKINFTHTDDTGLRDRGKNCFVNVYCNPVFTGFKINDNKKNETIEEFMKELNIKNFILVSDDAPQFKGLTEFLALCWVHVERHFKKLNPVLSFHKELLKSFRGKIWEYYDKLKEYKNNPNGSFKKKLDEKFDILFSEKTGYEELDKRINLTKKKKESLLVVLNFPEVPLHNNFAEQEIREFVIKRNVSMTLRSEKGRVAWENHFTILMTCRKQKVSYWKYLENKFSGVEQIPLAQRIRESAI